MINYFNSLLGVNIPFFVFIVVPVFLAALGFCVYWFVRTRVFKSRLRQIIKTEDDTQIKENEKNFAKRYPAEKLMRFSPLMERYSRQMGSSVVIKTGLAEKWTEKLAFSHLLRVADIRRVLLYCPSYHFFKAFIAAGQHARLRKYFINWTKKEGEEKVIRFLAESCRGENFDPAFGGKIFLENHTALLRELTGENEWYARYFAYRILLQNREALDERSIEAGLKDSHPLVRKILAESFDLGEEGKEKVFEMLWEKLVSDPVYEVREAARKRIAKEFQEFYSLKDKTLNDVEAARVLELLDPDCQEDRTFAMDTLESQNKELCYPAAVFLEKCGVLATILAKNTLDDQKNIEHSVGVLQKAMEVNVSGFLRDYPEGDGAPLLAAARLLSGTDGTFSCGMPQNILELEKKVFAFFHNDELRLRARTAEYRRSVKNGLYVEIYTKTLEAVSANGNIKSFEILAEELSRREQDKDFLELILPRLPAAAQGIFSPVLFRFLENTDFSARAGLVQVLGTFSPDIVLPEVFRILNGNRAKYPHIVRISAVKILMLLKTPFCLQRILESLPTLTPEQQEEFALLVADYPQDMFVEKAKTIFASPDAGSRASLINILPVIKNEKFLKEIRASLKDVDPDVRAAAVKSLLKFGEIKLLNQETSMLHDPVERVRIATAEVIARHGNAAALEILKNILKDSNETDVVKQAVLGGLGQAQDAEGISILVSVLDSDDELRKYAVKALANRTTKRDIIRLIEIFKDAEPQLREKLIPVFKEQGREVEPFILEILKDEVASLKPYLVQILEETGYVDEAKRRLSNRNVEVRREAAALLSLMETLPAFRGLVLAAKDPDREVRVCVVKALEKLKSEHSRDVLEKLKEDPDSRIRKYTYWALERLDSLAME